MASIHPLLSIIIPTKNRYEYLIKSVNAMLKRINGNDYEIIIEDNNESFIDLQNYLTGANKNKVKQFHTAKSIDIVTNTTNAISHSNGKYLVFIGDDDFVSPNILEIVYRLNDKNGNNLTYTPGNYYWPGVFFAKKSSYNDPSTLQIYKNWNNNFVVRNSCNELRRVLDKGGCYYLGLPRFYHGICSRMLLEKIKHRFGSYFPGPSPDISISIAIALTLDEYYFVNYPVTFTGVSAKSAAGMGASNKHFGEIEHQKFLPEKTKFVWDNRIPYYWTPFTIYAESVTEVLKEGHSELQLDFLMLYGFIYVFEKPARKYLKPKIKKYVYNSILKIIKYYLILLYLTFRKVLGTAVEYLKRKNSGWFAVKNISDADTAMEYIQRFEI